MTIDLSKAVETVLEEQDTAREMLAEDMGNDDAWEFAVEKIQGEFSGNVGRRTIEAELRTQVRDMSDD